jgi:hypothetical protein
MTSCLVSINSDFQLRSAVICVVLLPEGILLELESTGDFVTIYSYLFNNLTKHDLTFYAFILIFPLP